jgi:putative DNA primase/helicase
MDPKFFPAVVRMYQLGASFTPLAGKVPVLDNWQGLPREPLEQALAWAKAGNIGIRCGSASGGLVVVDVEKDAAPEAFPGLGLPPSLTVRTGSGGFHHYYRTPIIIKNSTAKLAPKVDVKAEGGQVVFVGSVHPDTGQPYEFTNGSETLEIAELPPAFIEAHAKHLRKDYKPPPPPMPTAAVPPKSLYAKAALEGECKAVAGAQEGTRNDTLNTAAFKLGQLVAAGALTADEVEGALLSAAFACGLSEHEARGAIKSGLGAGGRTPRQLPESVVNPPKARQPQDADNPEQQEDLAANPPPMYDEDSVVRLFLGENKRIVFYRDIFYRYDGRCYHQLTDAELRARLAGFVTGPEPRRKIWTLFGKQGLEQKTIKPHPNFLNQCLELLRGYGIIHYRPDVPFWIKTAAPATNHVAMNNGILNLDTYDLLPHTADCFTLAALDFDYDPEAACPRFMRFLDEVCEKDEQKICALQEVFGYCLQSSQDGQKIFIFCGEGKNGKTVTANVLKMLIGPGNCSAVPLEALHTPHATASMVGKMLNFSMEWKFIEAQAEGTLKAISGGDPVNVNPKNKPMFSTVLPTKILVVSNEMPHVTDRTHGMWRRLHIIPFNYVVPDQQEIPMQALLEEFKPELPGILNFAIEGLRQFRIQKGFTESKEMTDVRDDYRKGSSSVWSWAEEVLEPEPHGTCGSAEAYKNYCDWCKANGHKTPNSTTFGIEICRWFRHATQQPLQKERIQIGGSRVYQYTGVQFRSNALPPPPYAAPDFTNGQH